MIHVENNFLGNKYFIVINKKIRDKDFPWYLNTEQELFYHDLVTPKEKGLVNQSPFINLITPLVDPLKIEKIEQARLILTTKTNKVIKHQTLDFQQKYNKNLLSYFFLDSCDGYIQLINANKIDFVENKLLTISKNFPHFSTSHTNKKFSIMLMIDYVSGFNND